MLSSFKEKKGKMGTIGIKLDLEKAYDCLNWEYMSFVLLKFGFDKR